MIEAGKTYCFRAGLDDTHLMCCWYTLWPVPEVEARWALQSPKPRP